MQCLSGLYRVAAWPLSSPMMATARRGYSAIRQLTFTDDGTTGVALHPETNLNVPYSDTLPLPEEPVVSELYSPLRMCPKEAARIFSTESTEMARRQLAKITCTTIHRWYPRARDRKAKKTPMERRYL